MKIVSKDAMYAADKQMIEYFGVPGFTLMEHAGAAIAKEIRKKLRPESQVVILCGNGNNGGDGLVIGRYLRNYGVNVSVYLVPSVQQLTGDARKHYDVFRRFGYSVTTIEKHVDSALKDADVIVDALLGIGMQGQLRSPYDSLIAGINASSAQVISVDLPSGIWADGGKAADAVKADITYTLAFPKPASYLYPYADYFGTVHVVDIGIPQSLLPSPGIQTWEMDDLSKTFPKRPKNAHKGNCGKALIVGGSRSYQGAPLISAGGCLRCGIGLLALAVPQEVRRSAVSLFPEATYLPCIEKEGNLAEVEIPNHFDVIAVGMGLSRELEGRKILREVLAKEVPIVVDADGLYFLSQEKERCQNRKAPTILTPHEGEMARLTGISAEEIADRRFEIARKWAVSMGVTLVLKGSFTIVTTPQGDQFVNTTGNAGLAKGGSGDLLTGMIAAFLPTHKTVQEAVSNAVFLHGLAADYLRDQKGRTELGICASDLMKILPELITRIQKETL